MHFVFGKRAFFGYHIGSSGEMYWFVNFSQKEAPARGELDMIVSDAWQARMLDLFRGDLPRVSEMIRATQSTIIGYPISDIVTQPIWHQGPVVLVGDAIHAVSPQAGQGASLAIEDAMVLAKCLRDREDHALAFATYERLRRARVEQTRASVVGWTTDQERELAVHCEAEHAEEPAANRSACCHSSS